MEQEELNTNDMKMFKFMDDEDQEAINKKSSVNKQGQLKNFGIKSVDKDNQPKVEEPKSMFLLF